MLKHDRYKLNDPKTLPEELSFRREVVWSQLNKKLSKRNKVVYAGLIAAGFAGLIVFISVFYMNRTSTPASMLSQQPDNTIKQTSVAVNSNNERRSVITPQKKTAHTGKLISNKRTKVLVPVSSKVLPAEQETVKTPDVAIHQQAEVVPAGSGKPAIAAISKQGRFRIAHANELNAPVNKHERSIAGKISSELDIPEINQGLLPSKQNGLFGLLRSNQ